MKTSRHAPGLAALALLLSGCFYTVRNSVPGHIKSIAVPVFQNQSLQPAIEDELTKRVIDRFQSDNHLAIAEARDADALVEGRVTGYDNRVYRFNEQEQAQEYIVLLTMDVTVKDREKNKDLWSQEGIRTSATYVISGPQARTEAQARTDAIAQAADIILSRTVEGW
jgi:outer membrane lipopolysaccharide assembly protein LptE/RlpB